MTRCYIAIGSNLDEPICQARQALAALAVLPHSRLVASSRLYCSPPMGPQNQPDYINSVVALETILDPLLLLNALQAIERQQGRQHIGQRWGARTLDLDLLLYGASEIQSPRLTVPHHGLTVRPFVLYPLAEIAPALNMPDGTSLTAILHKVPPQNLKIVDASVIHTR